MPITGALLILVSGRDLSARDNWWLGIAIVLYVIAFGYSFFVQRKLVERAIELTSSPPPPDASGPPPELMAVGKRIGQGGMVMGIILVVIIFLMVVKPQF